MSTWGELNQGPVVRRVKSAFPGLSMREVGNLGFMPCLALVLLLLGMCGCGRQRDVVKVVVEGNVTFDQQPIVNGDIKFYPVEGTAGPVSGAAIKDGHYIVTNKDGVPVGTHTVQIRGFQVNQGSGADDDLISVGQSPPKSARRQYIPARYNQKTELIVEVTKKTREMDFNLEK